ncbi:MAG: flavodoxin family protein [Candidatus Hodarchaeales archaeon]|jgi:flavodoxin
MKILFVYYSSTGNTKKVVDLAKERLTSLGHTVSVKNALTAKTSHVEGNDLLIIGTPVHGYILFGQKPAKEVKQFLEQELPSSLREKPVIGFATYLFFPSSALNPIKKAIESRNGNLLGLVAQRRTKKQDLVEEIVSLVK